MLGQKMVHQYFYVYFFKNVSKKRINDWSTQKCFLNITLFFLTYRLSSFAAKRNSHLYTLWFFASSCGFTVENENFSSKKGYTLKQELAYYLTSRQDNPLDISSYWRNNSSKLPLLVSLVRKYCIIQATSVASESIFRIANYVGRKERASLSSRNLRFSMILREEPKFEKKV